VSFGRSITATLLSAAILETLGLLAVLGITRLIYRPGSPLGSVLAGAGLSDGALLLLGFGVVTLLAGAGSILAIRRAPRFTVEEGGLRIADHLGRYLLHWENLAEVACTERGDLGLRVHSRERVVSSHEGRDRQREWLRSQAPFGPYDFLFLRSALGIPTPQAVELIRNAIAASSEAR